ncbi:MAG: hypothetical protein RIR51_1305 [Bacteroidota bacterium]|jgi:carbonic anhydrase
MDDYKKLILNNQAWIVDILEDKPDYFDILSKGQEPKFLYIGCSDSRVPIEEITNSRPGDIFVHRNVANMVVHTDMNLLSVLQYAVEVLKVKHVIVCGHYNCGGVRAAMAHDDFGLINKWLRNIKEVYSKNRKEIESQEDFQKQFDKLVEFNVIEQANNVAKTAIVQKAWTKSEFPVIHGWVFDIHSGKIIEVCDIDKNNFEDDIFKFDLK